MSRRSKNDALEQTVMVIDDQTIQFLEKDGLSIESAEIPKEPLNIELPPSRFQFIAVLGSGGMGVVIRVHDILLHREIAMKVLHSHLQFSQERERFISEAQIEAQLQHPSIVSVHETGTLPSGHTYFTMREIKGTSFQDLLTERKAPHENRMELLQHLQRASEALGYAHARGVIH